MIKARGNNPGFAEQLDIHCSSNKEYSGKMSGLDFFCPVSSTNSKPGIQMMVQPRTATIPPIVIDNLLDSAMKTDAIGELATKKSTTSPHKTSTVPASTSSTSKIINGPRIVKFAGVSSITNAPGSTGSVSIPIVAIVVVLAVIVGVGFLVLCKKSQRFHKLLKSSKRDRFSSRQPFLEDEEKVDVFRRQLSEPFSISDDEEVGISQSPLQVQDKAKVAATTLTVEEDRFYTPRTTPRQTPKMKNHDGHADVA